MSDPKRFRAYIDVLSQLDRIWGRCTIGMELASAHATGTAVTADSLALSLGIGEDTARRYLEGLVRDAKVWVELEGRLRLYRPVAEYVDVTVNILRTAEKFHPQVAGKRGLR